MDHDRIIKDLRAWSGIVVRYDIPENIKITVREAIIRPVAVDELRKKNMSMGVE